MTFSAIATDNLDSSVSALCSPASGAVFPVGSTAVSCSAADRAGNSTSAAFQVRVKGAQEQLTDLAAAVAATGANHSLSATLDNALKSLGKGNTIAACGQSGAFLNQVQAQSGKSLSPAEAAAFTQSATRIMSVLGCR